MRIAKTFIAAVALALALVAAVVVPLALSAAAGTFGFDSWPTSAAPPPRENAVVIDQPLVLSSREAARAPSRPPVLRHVVVQARASAKPSGGALVAQVDRGSPRPIAKAPSAEAGTEQRPGGSENAAPDGPAEQQPSVEAPTPTPTPPAPDTVAVAPEPQTAPVPGPVRARPVAPIGVTETPVAEQPEDAEDGDGDHPHGRGNGRPDWVSRVSGGPQGHGHGHGRGHRHGDR